MPIVVYGLFGMQFLACALSLYFLSRSVRGGEGTRRKADVAFGLIFLTMFGVSFAASSRLTTPEDRTKNVRIGPAPVVPAFPEIGDVAPLFTLIDDEGRTFDLGQKRGDVVLILFFGIDCPPCIAEMPHVQTLFEARSDRPDFHVIAISTFDELDALQSLKKRLGLAFPFAADRAAKSFRQYAEPSIPQSFVVSRDGKIVYHANGFDVESFSEVVQAIDTELAADVES